MKRWGHDGDVVFVTGAFPWIIGDIDVAFTHVDVADTADEMSHSISHRVDVARCTGHCLGEHLTSLVVDPGRQVTGLSNRGRKSGAHQRLGLFLDNRDQAVPHDLIGNL